MGRWDRSQRRRGIALRWAPWASRKTSCSARSRSATSGSCGSGSPTCSGFLKSVAVAPAELEGAFAEGIGFDGSAIEGFARVYEADMLAKPDPSTFQILPWRGEGPATARMFCDIVMPDGSPVVRRPALRAQAHAGARRPRRASPSTRTPRSSSTCSRTRPSAGADPVPVDRSGYFDHTAQSHGLGLPPRGDHDARVDGHLGGVQPPRGRPGPAGDRPAVRRRAVAPPTTS